MKSSNINRVNKTIQITNSGISPGRGVGNKRKELSQDTLKIPVISIGIPTIVDAVAIVTDTINFLTKKLAYSKKNINNNSLKFKSKYNYLEDNIEPLDSEEKKKIMGLIGNLNEDETKTLIYEVLEPIGYNLMVTPKEIDFLIDKFSIVLGRAINRSLHKNFK